MTLVNPAKQPAEVFVTVLEAYASADEPRVVASLEDTPKGTTLLLRWPDHVRRFVLDLKRTDPAAAAIRDAD